jgi:hypothetical protein
MSERTSPEPVTGIAEWVRRRTDELAPSPVPWAALERRRRRGVVRRGSLAVAGMVAVAATVVLAVTSGFGPLTSTSQHVQPAGPWPGDPGLSAGSPWAEGLLRQVDVELGGSSGPGKELLYAGDVAGMRVALVHIRDGAPGDLYWWFMGPGGSVPTLMRQAGNSVPARAYALVLSPADAVATILALGPPGAELDVWTNDDVLSDGQAIQPHIAGEEVAAGVYQVGVPTPFNHAHVRLRGSPGGEWGEFVRSDEVQPPPVDDGLWWTAADDGVRGDTAAGPPDRLLIRGIYNRLALPSTVLGSRVLWTMRDGPDRYSVLALRTPSKGWALAGIRSEPPECSGGGCSEGSTVLAAEPRPDGDADGLAFACYLDHVVEDDGTFVPAGDRLAVVGPPGATQIRLLTGPTATIVPLPGGAGLVRRAGVNTVELLDGAGRPLGRTDVADPWQPNDRLGTD